MCMQELKDTVSDFATNMWRVRGFFIVLARQDCAALRRRNATSMNAEQMFYIAKQVHTHHSFSTSPLHLHDQPT